MLGICLQILAVIGIILLALLALVLVVLILVLFFPVTYHIHGKKDEGCLSMRAKAKWLFGLIHVNYRYPDPGHVIVKALWVTVYDSIPGEKKATVKEKGAREAESAGKEAEKAAQATDEKKDSGVHAAAEGRAGAGSDKKTGQESAADASVSGISQKIEKIKYTIKSMYDKIKEIWENISYYIELLREEETKQLFSYAVARLAKILRNIRPRRIEADILFGTGSPDTTGYAYGAYCMLSSTLRARVWVTPDFEKAVFQGRFDVAGHVALWVLTVNVLQVALDRRLRVFIRKMKAGRKASAKLSV